MDQIRKLRTGEVMEFGPEDSPGWRLLNEAGIIADNRLEEAGDVPSTDDGSEAFPDGRRKGTPEQFDAAFDGLPIQRADVDRFAQERLKSFLLHLKQRQDLDEGPIDMSKDLSSFVNGLAAQAMCIGMLAMQMEEVPE